MPNRRIIPLDTYPRRAHFEYFSSMAQPYAGVTAEVELTGFLRRVRGEKLPFFLSLLYCAANAANAVPELRRRIADGGIVEYDRCPTSHTVALPDGTYCYCALDSDMPLERFLPYAAAAQEEAKRRAILEDEGDALALLFVSSLPWLHYQALLQPTPSPADSNPRITWGKFREENGRAWLPVTLLCHHALCDGIHIARFYEALNEELERFANQGGAV